ncbi:MbcA/ParS/Xre antitoxin family protein [Shewanella marisflavi]|uniref:MbcA/ParS/Xre antitoxin family protein n=1 Tax=Shewanella marisflavi TaxID=260364 RepID=UPI003AAC4255
MSRVKNKVNAVDLQSPKTSKVGFDAAVAIMKHWKCKTDDMLNILRINRSSFFSYKSGKGEFTLDRDQLTRISYVLNIHAALRTVFSNPENVYGFMKMVNNNPYFEGRTPLEIIKDGGFGELHEVHSRIDSLRSGGW